MSGTRITQLGAFGAPETPSGSFAGKTPSSFPTQFAGLRVWHSGSVVELCLVVAVDALGGLRISKGGTTYGVYLVDTTDPDASPVRIKTAAGVKAIRLKT